MAPSRVLIDTSVIIAFLRKKDKQRTHLWKIRNVNTCFLSVITLFELYAGANTREKKTDVEKIATWITPVEFDAAIAAKAALFYQDLKSQNRTIDFRDIFIAATAVRHDFQLATLNIRHFSRIKELALLEIK